MGKPILYCSNCGRSLHEEDFERGKAGYQDRRPYCSDCRPDLKPVTPRSVARPVVDRTPPSGFRRLPPARRGSPTLPVALSAVGGALLMVLLVAGLSSSPKKPQPVVAAAPAPVRIAPEPPKPPPPPAPAPAPPVRPVVDEGPPPPPPVPDLDRWLDLIRTVRKDDPDLRRAAEVRSMLAKAAEIAGPRKGEVDTLLAAYEKELQKPAPVRAAATITGFTLINADTEKPVAGFDPLPAEAVVDLGRLGLKRIDIRVNTSPQVVPSLETVLNDGAPRGENGYPYSCTNNSAAGGYDGWIPSPGRQTLKVRLWSQKDRKGTAGPWVTLSFTIVDPR